MDLYICEKPSQAKDLAKELGCTERGNGSLSNASGKKIVTWAFGHLLEQYMPQDYDGRYKRWDTDDLPIMPGNWRYNVKKSGSKQFNIIKKLLAKAKIVFIATDYDREGESIAREIMELCSYKGPVKRVCLTALDPTSIQRALSSIKEDAESQPLYMAALGRQRADWLVGMNLSRLFTIQAKSFGYDEVLHIGRVITPTISLIVDRDDSINNFTPSPFYTIKANVSVAGGQFKAAWIPPEECSDESGRCTNKTFATQVGQHLPKQTGSIEKATEKHSKENAPLPFDLTSLQQYANKQWGYSADEVLEIAQALYETHKLTSYPRTDSRYIPESQHDDAPAIFQALMLSDQDISGLIAGAESSFKSRAFNDKKVTAHHGIIPTNVNMKVSGLSKKEFNLYDAIRRYYIAQFYGAFESLKKDVVVDIEGLKFSAKGKTPLKQGWKILFAHEAPDPEDEKDGDEPDENATLPAIHEGEPAVIESADMAEKMTRPAPHFTEATLLGAMENIARFVPEERLKKILKETSGLGTVATRAAIIKGAIDKGYIKKKGRTLLATDKAKMLVSFVPDVICSPGMTALWEQELDKIASNEQQLRIFMANIEKWMANLIEEIKANSEQMESAKTKFNLVKPTEECFVCGGELKQIKGKKGKFWACQNVACKKTFNDKKGKPEQRAEPTYGPNCSDCGKPTILRTGKKKKGQKKANSFYGCSGFPECKNIMAAS